MDVREKLVEFLADAGVGKTERNFLAGQLIANGVTVQELDGCEYCKQDRDGYRKMFGAFSITNPFHGKEWFVGTGHCKPRQIYFCPMCGREFQKKG